MYYNGKYVGIRTYFATIWDENPTHPYPTEDTYNIIGGYLSSCEPELWDVLFIHEKGYRLEDFYDPEQPEYQYAKELDAKADSLETKDIPKVIAVDFDGTLHFGRWLDIGEPNTKLIDELIKAQNAGAKIILSTCRINGPLAEAISWCRELGLNFDAVNDDLDIVKAKYGILPTQKHKIFADIYIDDKAQSPTEIILGGSTC